MPGRRSLSLEQESWARIVAYAWLTDEKPIEYDGVSYESFQDLLETDPKKGTDYLKKSVPAFKDLDFQLITDVSFRPRVSDDDILRKVANEDPNIEVIPDGFVRFPASTFDESLEMFGKCYLGKDWIVLMRQMLDKIESKSNPPNVENK
jgi:hypothetical protein